MKRRTYLVTTAGVVGLAGCAGSGDDPEDDENGDDDPNEGGDPNGDNVETDDDGTFDDFEDLDAWTEVEGSLTADEDRSLVGSQSALLEASESDSGVMIRREFDSPQDFSDEVPGLAVASDDLQNPIIQLTDENGDRVDFRGRSAADMSLMRYNFGVGSIDGDPDLSAISSIQIAAWTGDEKEKEFWCDDLYFTPRPETGTVMVQFDYGYETTYSEGFPVLEEYDIPATAFVNTDFVGGDSRMSQSKLEELHGAGWTIASQSANNGDLTDTDDPSAQIESAVEWLEDNGFEDGAGYFAYPLGNFDEAAVEAAGDHHDLCFASGYGAGGQITNTTLCPRVGDPDPDDARKLLEWTAEMKGLTTLYYHELEDDLLDSFEETMADLSEMEADGELEVVLPGDVEEEYVL
ncbi:polysaccharide deacetylase family protein [Halostagnicola bangensis]